MSNLSNPIIVIPARMSSTRLPGKPLAEIDGLPMILQVLRRAEEADIGPAIVACGEKEIADVVESAGGTAIMTQADHPSGSDRVFEAVEKFDPDGRYDAVVNLQGDLPALDPRAVSSVFQPLLNEDVDIATLVAEITDNDELDDESAVKAVVSFPNNSKTGRAIWFSRLKSPWGEGPHYHHIGIYAYRRNSLKRFVSLPVAPLEAREKLEQLRALEAGMRIDAALVDTVPLGVDTPEDLARIRLLFNKP